MPLIQKKVSKHEYISLLICIRHFWARLSGSKIFLINIFYTTSTIHLLKHHLHSFHIFFFHVLVFSPLHNKNRPTNASHGLNFKLICRYFYNNKVNHLYSLYVSKCTFGYNNYTVISDTFIGFFMGESITINKIIKYIFCRWYYTPCPGLFFSVSITIHFFNYHNFIMQFMISFTYIPSI